MKLARHMLVTVAIAAVALAGCSTGTGAGVSSPVATPTATVASTGASSPASTPTGGTRPASTAHTSRTSAAASARTATPASSKATAAKAPVVTGLVARVKRTTKARVKSSARGKVVTTLHRTTRGVATWVPVTAIRTGWVQVAVPGGRGKGDRAAWVRAADLTVASTGHAAVIVDTRRRMVAVHVDGKRDRSWRVLAVGPLAGKWRTPTGVHHIQRVVKPGGSTGRLYGLVVETSARSADPGLARGGGSLGDRIAFHGWRRPLSKGATSHGCIRLPIEALEAVAQLPLGTPVEIH